MRRRASIIFRITGAAIAAAICATTVTFPSQPSSHRPYANVPPPTPTAGKLPGRQPILKVVAAQNPAEAMDETRGGLTRLDIDGATLSAPKAQQDIPEFRPTQILLPDVAKNGGVLLETDAATYQGANVAGAGWQGELTAHPLLRVYGPGVREGAILGLPMLHRQVTASEFDDTLHRGKLQAGGHTLEVQAYSGGGLTAVHFDGKPQPLYGGVYAPRLGAGGRHWTYCGVSFENLTQFPVIDGKKAPEYDRCTGVVISPDGNHWAYHAIKDGQAFIVVDGNKWQSRPCSLGKTVSIEPKGYSFQSGNELILWSPDSRHVASVMLKGDRGKKNDRYAVFVDDQEVTAAAIRPYLDARHCRWSPDSRRFAYIGRDDKNEECMVVDGKVLEPRGAVRDFAFSPDSQRFAYIALTRRSDKHEVICDGKILDVFSDPSIYGMFGWTHDVACVVFSPDSKHLAYVGHNLKNEKNKEFWYVGMDGRNNTFKTNDDILTCPAFADGKLMYVAIDRNPKTVIISLVSEKVDGVTTATTPAEQDAPNQRFATLLKRYAPHSRNWEMLDFAEARIWQSEVIQLAKSNPEVVQKAVREGNVLPIMNKRIFLNTRRHIKNPLRPARDARPRGVMG
jgi:hypothetical protein